MKVIISDRSKQHMEAHREDFLIPYEDLIEWCRENGQFEDLAQYFEVIEVEFPFYIGYGKLFETGPGDDVVFAMRVNRDIYTRFIKNREPYLIKSCVICLRKNLEREGKYYLVTMFPGFKSEKEPQDKSISTMQELKKSLDFWNKHALLYEPGIIQLDTITRLCPYHDLYDIVAG